MVTERKVRADLEKKPGFFLTTESSKTLKPRPELYTSSWKDSRLAYQ